MIKNLQVLRAIAALLVVFFHCEFLGLKIGQFGVDIFFVISGFIISFILNKNQKSFLIKRFIRVVPMYYLFTVAVILVWAVYPEGVKNVFISPISIVKSLLFIPYLVGSSGPILSLGWTLNFEIFFYVTVGVFAIILKSPARALLFSTFTILLIFLAGALMNVSNFYLSFYSYEIIIEFSFGIALYYMLQNWGEVFKSRVIMVLLGLVCFVSFCLMGYFDHNKIYFSRALVFGLPSFFVVLFFIASENFVRADHPIYDYFHEIGNASYVIYLAHPFIIFFIARLISPIFGGNLFYEVLELILKLSLVVLVSNWIHKNIELPLVRSTDKFLHPQKHQHHSV